MGKKVFNEVAVQVGKRPQTSRVRAGSIITDENGVAHIVYIKSEKGIYCVRLTDRERVNMSFEILNNQFTVLVDPVIEISATAELEIKDN